MGINFIGCADAGGASTAIDALRSSAHPVIGIRDGKQISYAAFSAMKLLYPPVVEQNKTASFLGELDKKIDFTRQQIEQTKTFIKGLGTRI